MVENRPLRLFLTHFFLIVGIAIVVFPIYVALVASTHEMNDLLSRPPLWFGTSVLENYSTILFEGKQSAGATAVGTMLVNSLVMALGISVGKIGISIIAAYAIVYFHFPLRSFFFWLIFFTLMLPVEVRIIPTFKIAADLGLLDSYAGLILPLIASATATFLFRQFFLTIPDEFVEAARIDGAGPIRFFLDILLPLSKTYIAALFVIVFTYGWNQYLWPLLVTTDIKLMTIVVGIKQMIVVEDATPEWNLTMSTAILATLPPLLVVVLMQRQFVKGLVETEK